MKKSHYRKSYRKSYSYSKEHNQSNKSRIHINPKLAKFLIVLLLFLFIPGVLLLIAKLVPEISQKIKIGFSISAYICFGITVAYIIYNIGYTIRKLVKGKKETSIKDTIDNAKSITDYIESKTNSPTNRYKSTQNKYSTSKKCKRQNQLSRHTKNRKINNQKAKSYRFPLELDADGYFCTYIDEDEFLYRVDLGITKEIEDISQYQVRIRIRIEDNYIQSANLFYNDEVSEQIKVLNPDALQ